MPNDPIPNTPARSRARVSGDLPERQPGEVSKTYTEIPFEGERAAYEALSQAASQIRTRIGPQLARAHGAPPWTLVFLDRPPSVFVEVHDAFKDQVQTLCSSFNATIKMANASLSSLKDDVFESSSVVTEDSSGAVNLLGILQTGGSTKTRLTIDPIALALELAHQFEAKAKAAAPDLLFFDLRFFKPRDSWLNRSWSVDVLDPLNAVIRARERAFHSIHALSQAVYKDGEKGQRQVLARSRLDYARDHFEHADQILRALQGHVHTVAEDTGSLLQMIQIGSAIRAAAEHTDTRFLFVKVVSASGKYRTTRSHTGGVIMTFGLCDHSGRLISSGIVKKSISKKDG